MSTVGEDNMTSPKASETEDTKSAADKKSNDSTEYVKYLGGASRREIKVADWRKSGVMDMKTDTNFTFGNEFKLPKKDFSEKALEYLLNERRTNGARSFQLVTE